MNQVNHSGNINSVGLVSWPAVGHMLKGSGWLNYGTKIEGRNNQHPISGIPEKGELKQLAAGLHKIRTIQKHSRKYVFHTCISLSEYIYRVNSGLFIQAYEQVITEFGFTVVDPVHIPWFYISLHHHWQNCHMSRDVLYGIKLHRNNGVEQMAHTTDCQSRASLHSTVLSGL